MQNISLVKFRKYPRRIVLRRRTFVTIPEKTVKYIHKSAAFTKMMSDLGVERIGTYVQSMANHTEVLAEMINTGIINDLILAVEVESISQESERTGADLALIGNSLIRFMHADSERIKSSHQLKARMGKTLTPENEQVTPSLPVPVRAEAPKTVLAVGDTCD